MRAVQSGFLGPGICNSAVNPAIFVLLLFCFMISIFLFWTRKNSPENSHDFQKRPAREPFL